MTDAKSIAVRLIAEGFYPELTTDDVKTLALEYLRLHSQRSAGEGDVPAPPADAATLRRQIEDIVDPPEDRQP